MERTFIIQGLEPSRYHTVFTKEALENAIKSVEDRTVYIYANQNPNEEPSLSNITGVIKEVRLDEESNFAIAKAEMLDNYKNYEELFEQLAQAGVANVSMSCKPMFEAQDDSVYLKYLNLELDVPPSRRK